MIRTILLLCLAAVVTIAQVPPTTPAPAPGQPQQNQEQEAEPKEPGRVEGAVLLAGSDAPVRKAMVTLFGRGMRVPLNATTSEDGSFVFEKVPPGDYNFSARHVRFVAVDKSGDDGPFAGRKISISEGQAVKGVVFKMVPGAVVTGKVYDEYGDPQPGAMVFLQLFRYINGKKQMTPSGRDNTDDRGEYRIFNVAPGKYYLSASYRIRTWGREVARSEASDSSYPTVYYPGVLEPETAMELELRANEERQGMDLRLVLDRAVRVKGRVMLGGKPAREAYVRLMPKGSMQFERMSNQPTDPKTGEFEFSGVRPGTYSLNASATGTGGSRDRLAGVAEVQVASSNIDGVMINLSSGMEIPGQVILEGDNSGAVGFEEQVTRVGLSREGLPMFGGSGFGAVKPDGSFKLAQVMPGEYRLRVLPLPEGGYLAGAVFGDQDVFGQRFQITQGAQGPLTVRIRMSAATVAGVVEDEDGRPLPDVRVMLAPEASKRERRELFATDGTDQYGNFSFKNVAPGEYKAWAFEKLDRGRHMEPDFLAAIEDEGEKIEADDNGSYSLKLKLTEAPDL